MDNPMDDKRTPALYGTSKFLPPHFIKKFSAVANSQTRLFKGNSKNLELNLEVQHKFKTPKNPFATAPILKLPDPEKPSSSKLTLSVQAWGLSCHDMEQ